MDKIQHLIDLEWDFFQATQNRGGRAPCQDDYETFQIMRKSQAMAWTEAMTDAWTADLEHAKKAGRNPVAEKYARMMAFTHPEEYQALSEYLPVLDPGAEKLARELTDQTVAWAEDAAKRFPTVCSCGRPIRSASDNPAETSLETYCYGEFLTCSVETLRIFQQSYQEMARRGENLYITVETNTARFMGYQSLEDAEQILRSAKDK